MQRTIEITLVEPAAYNRRPLWRASDRYWPSIPSVEFRADDQGNGNLMRMAAELLDQSERDNAVD